MVSFSAPLVADLRAVCTVCNPSSGASGHLHHRVRYGHDQAVYLKPLDLDPYYKGIDGAGDGDGPTLNSVIMIFTCAP